MSFKTTFRLFLMVCALALCIWFAERDIESSHSRRENNVRLLEFKSEDVTGMIIERGDLCVNCARQEDSWVLKFPLEARADKGCIEAILSSIEALPREEVITAEERESRELTIADYGLSEPRVRLVVRTSLERHELLVGRQAPVGDNIYVKLALGDEVVSTTDSLLDSLPQTLEELRDRTLVPGEPGRTVRIEVRMADGGFVQLARDGSAWQIRQPIGVPAEGGKIEAMLDALFAAEVEKFVWDPPSASQTEDEPAAVDLQTDAPVQTFGLADDEATVRVHVWLSGDQVGSELILGKPVEGEESMVYAKLRGSDSVYAVRDSLVKAFSVSVNEIRTRNVFLIHPSEVRYACLQEGDVKLVLARRTESWMLTEPVQWPADDELVDTIVSQLCRLRVIEFADPSPTNAAVLDSDLVSYIRLLAEEPPPVNDDESTDVELEGATPEGATDRGRLQIGVMDPARETVLAKFENESTFMKLRIAEILAMGLRPSEPLLYRDRTMLMLAPAQVRRIHIRSSEFEEAVVRDAEGNWMAEAPPEGRADVKVIDDILLSAARTRAVWTESHNPADLSVYGLDNPSGSMTFGLTGDGGIQKSVLLGTAAGPVGVYAMVKGQDVVFVLPSGTVDVFSRHLIIPPAPAPGAGQEETDDTAK